MGQRVAISGQRPAAGLAELPRLIAEADLVISCTGAPGIVITADMARDALAACNAVGGTARDGRGPVVFIDLALPRDVDPALDGLPGAVVIGLDDIGAASRASAADADAAGVRRDVDIAAVRRIVGEEGAAHASAVHAARGTPTVVALRAKAAKGVDAELIRLACRLPGPASHRPAEITHSTRRVVAQRL